MEKQRLFPNIKQGIWLLLLFIVLQIALVIPLLLLQTLGFLHDADAVATLVPTVSIFIILLIGISKNNESLRDAYAIKPIRSSYYVPMFITLLGTGIIVSELNNILEYFWPAPDWLKEMFSGSGLELVFLVVVLAPVMEELLFRGFFLRGFLTHTSATKAVIWSALFFGIAHLNPWQFIVAIIAGFLFGWWYVQTKSLMPGLIGHAVHNGFPFILAITNIKIPGYTIPGEFQPLWFNILGLALAGTGIILTRMQFKRYQDEEPDEKEPPVWE